MRPTNIEPSPFPLIDSHCHLDSADNPQSSQTLIQEAQSAGLVALVTIGTDLHSIPEMEILSEKNPTVFHTVGIHPHEAEKVVENAAEKSANWETQLEQAARHPRCRAIGEIGLDYFYDHSPRTLQREILQKQVEIALQLKKPIVIHSREGEKELLDVLTSYSARVSHEIVPGVIHCFSGTPEFGKKCLDLGFYLSLSGIITFKKADELRESVRSFPLEKLLIETDSPFLAPVPFRGQKCEPKMVVLTAKKLAEIKNVSLEEVADRTTKNAKKLFQIEIK
jgi:TatD DNase family protein